MRCPTHCIPYSGVAWGKVTARLELPAGLGEVVHEAVILSGCTPLFQVPSSSAPSTELGGCTSGQPQKRCPDRTQCCRLMWPAHVFATLSSLFAHRRQTVLHLWVRRAAACVAIS